MGAEAALGSEGHTAGDVEPIFELDSQEIEIGGGGRGAGLFGSESPPCRDRFLVLPPLTSLFFSPRSTFSYSAFSKELGCARQLLDVKALLNSGHRNHYWSVEEVWLAH